MAIIVSIYSRHTVNPPISPLGAYFFNPSKIGNILNFLTIVNKWLKVILSTVSLDLTSGMTDSFEGRGAYSRGWGIFEGGLIRGALIRGGGLLEDLR